MRVCARGVGGGGRGRGVCVCVCGGGLFARSGTLLVSATVQLVGSSVVVRDIGVLWRICVCACWGGVGEGGRGRRG